MTEYEEFRVDCGVLDRAAAALDDVVWQAEEDFRRLPGITASVTAAVPGTLTAEAAARFGQRWERRLARLVDDTEGLSRKLRQVADNYCGADERAAGTVDDAGRGPAGIPGVPGGGYIPPNSGGVPGGVHLPPNPDRGTDGIPGAVGGGYIPPHSDYPD